MNPPSYMAYALVLGVVLVSFIAPAILGFSDAWFVPLTILPFAALYLAWDRKIVREQGEQPDAGH